MSIASWPQAENGRLNPAAAAGHGPAGLFWLSMVAKTLLLSGLIPDSGSIIRQNTIVSYALGLYRHEHGVLAQIRHRDHHLVQQLPAML